jgi:hypothetical protein
LFLTVDETDSTEVREMLSCQCVRRVRLLKRCASVAIETLNANPILSSKLFFKSHEYILLLDIVTCLWLSRVLVTETGFGLVIGFINRVTLRNYKQLLKYKQYSAIVDLHFTIHRC